MSLDAVLLDALKALSPTSVLLCGVIIFLWRELTKEREARITAMTASVELGHMVRQSLDKLTEALNRRP